MVNNLLGSSKLVAEFVSSTLDKYSYDTYQTPSSLSIRSTQYCMMCPTDYGSSALRALQISTWRLSRRRFHGVSRGPLLRNSTSLTVHSVKKYGLNMLGLSGSLVKGAFAEMDSLVGRPGESVY